MKLWNKDDPVRGLNLSNQEQTIILPGHGAVRQKYKSAQGSLIQRSHSILDLSYTPAKMCCRDFSGQDLLHWLVFKMKVKRGYSGKTAGC